MIQKDINEVVQIFDNNMHEFLEAYDIKLIYIFGSYAKWKNNPNSDLDIALLLNNDYDSMIKLDLIGELTLMFKRNDIDLVILNEASPVLRHQIIKYGKGIFMKNEDIKVDFEVKVLREYMDMEYFRNTQMKYINEWAKRIMEEDKI